MVPDERLIHMARQGEQSAAESLFRRYHERIYSYLVRVLGDRDLAEDAAQETFVRGFRSLKSYQEQGSFKSWLFRIAHREGLRTLKKERRNGIPDTAQEHGKGNNDDIADSTPIPSDFLMQQEQAQQLERALQILNDAERQVVLLRMQEGLPFKEIAKITRSPLNTVLSRMHTAVKKLQKELRSEGEQQ